MSARLTPAVVAEREIARCQQRQDRLEAELQTVAIDMSRWQKVLDAINGANGDDPAHHDDGVGAE